MNLRHVYYYEGETERKLISTLKNDGDILHGKLQKFNFWQTEATKIVRKISGSSVLYIIFDTDTINVKSTEKFILNMKLLVGEKKVKEIYLIAQHQNLEDELRFSCTKNNLVQLFKDFYNINSSEEFKAKLIKESNLSNKLKNNNFDVKKLWSRKEIYSSALSCISNKKINTDSIIK